MTGEMPWWCYGDSWQGRSRKFTAAKLCSTQILMHMHTKHTYTHTHLCIHMCMHTHMHAYTHIQKCPYTCMHTYIHTHTCTTTHWSKVLDTNVSASWWVLVSATCLHGVKNPCCPALANTPDPSCSVCFPASSQRPQMLSRELKREELTFVTLKPVLSPMHIITLL